MDIEPPDARLSRILAALPEKTARVVELQRALTACRAFGPENGGDGEIAKAELVSGFLAGMGITDIQRVDSVDPRVPCGIRPNLVARLPGYSRRRLWIFGHLDVVCPGDPSAWTRDPWTVCRDGDYVYGRGVEDNQQAICSMLILAECLRELDIMPDLGLGLIFMADEECGSSHGLVHVLETVADLFPPGDFYIVPDGGSPDGSKIEMAEKAQLWLKFTVLGVQCHASNPFLGRNAFLASANFACRLEAGLREVFADKDPDFVPPVSTFVPSMHPANVEAINIMPGRDEFYVDCRLLPGLSVQRVLDWIAAFADTASRELRAPISFEVIHCQKASETPGDSPIIAPLVRAIRAEYHVEPALVGIGGATVAAFLRQKGLPAVVWSCLENTCHQPNERSSLKATCKDAAVFARLLFPCDANAG